MLADLTGGACICASLLAGLHQLYLGFIYEGADGFNPLMLMGWLCGDVFNIIGCFWGRQLLFQRIVSLCSLTMDILLILQHTHFERMRTLKGLRAPLMIVSASRIIPGVHAMSVTEEPLDYHFIMGQAFAYISQSLYFAAIVPQVLHNFRRKYTGSVSLFMFLTDTVANANYLATIFLTAMDKDGEVEMEFVLAELPFILGNACCMMLNIVLLFQYYIYPPFIVNEIYESTEYECINEIQPIEAAAPGSKYGAT